VRISGVPPSADTRDRPDPYADRGVNTIVPSSLHVPARMSGESQSVTGAPPVTATFLSFPSAKNPSQRESGEKNRLLAPSVPDSGAASRASSGRT
jgi:hypothetical protein